MDHPGKVSSPACGQLTRKNEYFIFPCSRPCLRIWSRETDSAVPSRVSLLISILGLNLVLTYGIPPEFRGGVHLFIYNRHTPSGQSRVYRVTQLRTVTLSIALKLPLLLLLLCGSTYSISIALGEMSSTSDSVLSTL